MYTPGSEQWKVTARNSGELQTFIAFLIWGTIIELLTQRGVDNEVFKPTAKIDKVTSYYVKVTPLPLHGWSLVGFSYLNFNNFPGFVLTNKHHDLAQGLKHMHAHLIEIHKLTRACIYKYTKGEETSFSQFVPETCMAPTCNCTEREMADTD